MIVNFSSFLVLYCTNGIKVKHLTLQNVDIKHKAILKFENISK